MCIEILSVVGLYQIGIQKLGGMLEELVADGLKAVLVFGVVKDEDKKDSVGRCADDPQSPVVEGIQFIKKHFPGVLGVLGFVLVMV